MELADPIRSPSLLIFVNRILTRFGRIRAEAPQGSNRAITLQMEKRVRSLRRWPCPIDGSPSFCLMFTRRRGVEISAVAEGRFRRLDSLNPFV